MFHLQQECWRKHPHSPIPAIEHHRALLIQVLARMMVIRQRYISRLRHVSSSIKFVHLVGV